MADPANMQAAQGEGAPMGTSPATSPSPNAGFEAAARQRLQIAIGIIAEVVQMAGVGSDIGQIGLDFIKKAGKLIPPGSVSPQAEMNALQARQTQAQQQSAMIQQMRNAQAAPAQA